MQICSRILRAAYHTEQNGFRFSMFLLSQPRLKAENHRRGSENHHSGWIQSPSYRVDWRIPVYIADPFFTLSTIIRRGLRGKKDYKHFRECRICEENLFNLSAMSQKSHSHSLWVPRRQRSWHFTSQQDVHGGCFRKRWHSGHCKAQTSKPSCLHAAGAGDPRGWVKLLTTVLPEWQETWLLEQFSMTNILTDTTSFVSVRIFDRILQRTTMSKGVRLFTWI